MHPTGPEYLYYRTDGSVRHVGFELEFSGLTFDRCLEVIDGELGDRVSRTSQVEATISSESLGDFTLELDWQFLKDQARANTDASDLIRFVADIAGTVVPLELVCPPIETHRVKELDGVIEALRRAGAKGTNDSFLYAFGVHINPEIPDLEASTIVRYLKAYCILQDYLLVTHAIDPSRRLSPYVDLYKPPYIQQVLAYEAPDVERLISDYLFYNPTRNRALDMLPLFSELDEKLIQRRLRDPRIKSRPTFHYRMPNCHIERPSWTLRTDWNVWYQVERIANNPEALDTLGQEYERRLKADQFATDSDWAEYLRQWIKNRLDGQTADWRNG